MAQAPCEHGFSFDLLSLFQDLFPPAEVDIGRRQVAQALVVTAGVVVIDKVPDLAFEMPGQEVMLEQHAVIRFADLRLMVWCHRSILPWVCGW